MNKGVVYANYINCIIEIPEKIFEENYRLSLNSNKLFRLDNKVRDVLDVEMKIGGVKEKLGPARYEPLLPKLSFDFENNIPYLHEFYRDHLSEEIKWTVFADNSEPIKGTIKIEDIKFENIYH